MSSVELGYLNKKKNFGGQLLLGLHVARPVFMIVIEVNDN